MYHYLLTLPESACIESNRLENLCFDRSFYISTDPKEGKVGSGGGTSNLIVEAYKKSVYKDLSSWLSEHKKIIIHAGGESRRLPAYAHTGKIFAPIPVLRWEKGQHLNQTLFDLQAPLLEDVMRSTSVHQNVLVASGDVLVRNTGKLPKVPEADVVCYGLWGSPEKACNHGVFFTSIENSNELRYVLQKPGNDQIAAGSLKYHYFLDVGIWILSDRAVDVLLKKSGWNNTEEAFSGGRPEYYDLYSDFGICLGSNPTKFDSEISNLSVAIVTLDQGEFYHFGRSSELIESNERLQNLIVNQKEIWHKKVKPHPSIFIQNSFSEVIFTSSSRNIWIENSYVSSRWSIASNHILTGIPKNEWKIELAAGSCLDFVPFGSNDEYIIRFYGYTDEFKGELGDHSTKWMGTIAKNWFLKHNIPIPNSSKDIQQCDIFPVLKLSLITDKFVEWLVNSNPESSKLYQETYMRAIKISASSICSNANLKRLYEQRNSFTKESIPLLAKNYKNSIFYQLDLNELATFITSNNIILPEISDIEGIQRTNDLMLRSKVEKLQGGDGKDLENKAFATLKEYVLNTNSNDKLSPKLNIKEDQIVWGRSPLRMDFGGGWSDTPPYCFMNGGAVVNVAIEINGQPPIQVFIKPSLKREIILNSIDLGEKEVVKTYRELEEFDIVGSPFSIPKAAMCLVGFHPKFNKNCMPTLEAQLNEFGGGVEISILSAVPKGSGLGTSSILAATILGTLSEFCTLDWDKSEIANKTLVLEQLLTTGGGWQDQIGGLFHGMKLIETNAGFDQKVAIRWLPTDLLEMPQYKGTFLLYYTGITRTAKSILAEIVQGMFLNSSQHLKTLNKIKAHASIVFDTLMRGSHDDFAEAIATSWSLNKELDNGTTTSEIESIVNLVKSDLKSFKLLGAGGGGFMFMIAKDSSAAMRIRNILEVTPPNSRARFVDFEVSKTGFLATKS